MFKRSIRSQDQSQSQHREHRVDKSSRLKKSGSVRDPTKASKLQRSFDHERTRSHGRSRSKTSSSPSTAATATAASPSSSPSAIVTLTVGPDGRLFAAHENVLAQSPFFEAACRSTYAYADSPNKRIALPEEEPEVFSAVLEFLYKGDYFPRLVHNRQRNSWELEHYANPAPPTPDASPNLAGDGCGQSDATIVYLSSLGAGVLRDTVIYCAAERYGLEELKRLALRKQGLQAGIDVATILRSAQYAYAHTPDSDSRLRAHYLALIIRCRRTFKRSGTMQAEMEAGGSKLFFDLFVAMCNHLDDVIDVSNARTPKTV